MDGIRDGFVQQCKLEIEHYTIFLNHGGEGMHILKDCDWLSVIVLALITNFWAILCLNNTINYNKLCSE